MSHQGMVHALQQIHRLLTPSGILVDIHPVLEAPLVEVLACEAVVHAEPEPDVSLEDYRQAELALAEVVDRGFYTLDSTSEFELLVRANSVSELVEFEQDTSAYVSRQKSSDEEARERGLMARVEQALCEAGPASIIAIRERGRISRYSLPHLKA